MTERPRLSANSAAALFGLGAYALFSTHDVIVKHLGATYSPFQIVFFTALLSFPFITLAIISDQTPGTLRPVHPWWMTLRSITGSGSGICAYYAFTTLPLAEAYAFLFAAPLLITLLAIPMLGEKVRFRRGIAVAVGLLGVLIVLRPGAATVSGGHIAALAAATMAAMSSIVVRKIGGEERRVVMLLYPMMTNLVMASLALPFVYVEVSLVDLGYFAVAAALVLVAMTCLVAAYSRGAALIVAPMQYSQIIWGAVFGALLFGELPDWRTYAGAAIIVASGVYILKREATVAVSRTTPVLETRTRVGPSFALRVSAFLNRRGG